MYSDNSVIKIIIVTICIQFSSSHFSCQWIADSVQIFSSVTVQTNCFFSSSSQTFMFVYVIDCLIIYLKYRQNGEKVKQFLGEIEHSTTFNYNDFLNGNIWSYTFHEGVKCKKKILDLFFSAGFSIPKRVFNCSWTHLM